MRPRDTSASKASTTRAIAGAGEVGSFAADRHVFFVVVTDGQLNVRFITRRGFGSPMVNALQVTHRPDR